MTASFDLTAAEASVYPTVRSIGRFMLVGTVFMIIFWAAGMAVVTPTILRRLPSLISRPNVGWFVLVLYGLIITWGIVDGIVLNVMIREQFTHGGRGPVRLEIDSEGVHFFWTKGKSRLEPWRRGVRSSIVIRDFSASGYQAQVQVARFTSFALTGEAAHGIVSEANRLGLQVASSPTSGSTGTQGTLFTISRTVHPTRVSLHELA